MGDVTRAALTALPPWLAVLCTALVASHAAAEPASELSPTTEQLAGWVVASGDNAARPFVIVDKTAATVAVYGPDGSLQGATPALLGAAIGDDSAPGIGERKLSAILPEERTTPAGRFVAAYGYAAGDRKVLWVDYGTAISLHAVPAGSPSERRLSRLKSPTPEDNRITYGCINVSARFYEEVVRKAFTGTDGLVYVLPEAKPLAEVLPAFAAQLPATAVAAEGGDTVDFMADATLGATHDDLDLGAGGSVSPISRPR